jgi:hypothetical protein
MNEKKVFFITRTWNPLISQSLRSADQPDKDVRNGMLRLKDKVSGLYYKCFTIVIYDRNDSGQYYKTTITIVIDDPRLS